MDNGWLIDREGKPNLVALLSSAHEASLGLAQLHRGGVIHGGLSPATCFLKAARNQRGFVVKVCRVFQHFGVWSLDTLVPEISKLRMIVRSDGSDCKFGATVQLQDVMLCMTADTSSSSFQATSACFAKFSCQHTIAAAHCFKTAELMRLENIWKSSFQGCSYAAVVSLLSALTVLFVQVVVTVLQAL